MIEFRRARPEDYPAILDLQNANFVANLSDAERKEGFLSAQFSAEQTAQIAEDMGTMVALVDLTGTAPTSVLSFENA